MLKVLKVFAYKNQKIKYCQGLNFLAGFILFMHQDESHTFMFMSRIIEKYEMEEIYVKNVPLLKVYFYKMDCIIMKNFPEIGTLFRNEGVNSSLFSTNWILTIFAHSLQHAKDDKPSPMLLKIWDYFLLDGWKAIFKVSLFILNELKSIIMESSFEKIVDLFAKVSKAELLHDEVSAEKFQKNYQNIKVTRSELKEMENEYINLLRVIKTAFKENDSLSHNIV